MASINLQKGKCDMKKALYGIPGHNYRTNKNHSNKDIDPTRSHLNKHFGPQTPQEFRERFRKMVAAMDEKHPPKRMKKDRKVLLMMDTPSPREGMTMEDEAKWGDKVHEIMEELFPGQVVGSTYHADEVHEYKLEKGGKVHISRGHTHTAVIPWTDEKGLNMDAFYDYKSKALPNKINEALDKACQEMFGFPYRDGSYQKSKGDVEKMKLQSEIVELEEIKEANTDYIAMQDKQIEDNQEKLQEGQEALQNVKDEKMDAESELEALRGKYEALEGKYEALEGEYKDLKTQTATTKEELAATKEELAEAKSAFARFMEKVEAWIASHHGLERVIRAAVRLSEPHRRKIEQRMEATYEQGGKAILEASESVEDLLAAENEVERGKRTFDTLKVAVKKDLDPDELLEDGWERG